MEEVKETIEQTEVGSEPTPIENTVYLNYFVYLKRRLSETFGELRTNEYINLPVISMGLSTLISNQSMGMDGDIINTINLSNVEFLKDISRDEKYTEKDMVGYYVELKEPVAREISESDAIEHAEKMIAGFYTFLFCEVLK